MKRLILIGALTSCMLAGPSSSVSAFPVILDSTNSWSVDIEPGATVFRFLGDGPIRGSGVEFAIGTSSSAVFPGQTQIGNGNLLGGFRPVELVQGSIPFAIQVTSNDHLYDALLTYFLSPESGAVGVAPSPNNTAAAVFSLQGPVNDLAPIPEPATLLLVGTTMAGMGLARLRRRKRKQP